MLGNNGHAIISESKLDQRNVRLTQLYEDSIDATSSDPDLPYLSASSKEIVNKITVLKEWTALRVLSAYVRSAIKSQNQTNSLTEIMFESAYKAAKALDTQFIIDGKPVGIRKKPLPFLVSKERAKLSRRLVHGVPISLKDHYNVQGVDSTVGFSQSVIIALSTYGPTI